MKYCKTLISIFIILIFLIGCRYIKEPVKYNEKGEIIIPDRYLEKYGSLTCRMEGIEIPASYGGHKIGYNEDGIIACELTNGPVAIDINGKLAFVVHQNGKEFVVYDGKELTKYDEAGWLKNVNGKLSYNARDKTNWKKDNWESSYAEIFNGKVLRYKSKGISVGNIIEVDGKLVYTTSTFHESCNQHAWALVIDDTPGECYSYIDSDSLKVEEGKITFRARPFGDINAPWINVVDERLV